MNESTPTITDEDINDLMDGDIYTPENDLMDGEMVVTLLGLWRDVLSNIESGQTQRITPLIANKITGSWPKIEFKDLPAYWEKYHNRLKDLRQILHDEIQSNPDALDNVSDDAEANRKHYLNLIFEWTNKIQTWEDEWDVTSDAAAVDLAAIADAASFFIGAQGLVEHLSQPQIGFVFDEADREDLDRKLTEASEARE